MKEYYHDDEYAFTGRNDIIKERITCEKAFSLKIMLKFCTSRILNGEKINGFDFEVGSENSFMVRVYVRSFMCLQSSVYQFFPQPSSSPYLCRMVIKISATSNIKNFLPSFVFDSSIQMRVSLVLVG